MKTKNIRVERTPVGIRAFIITEYRGNIFSSRIKEPFSTRPFYILDGKRHELKDTEIETLRERIEDGNKQNV